MTRPHAFAMTCASLSDATLLRLIHAATQEAVRRNLIKETGANDGARVITEEGGNNDTVR